MAIQLNAVEKRRTKKKANHLTDCFRNTNDGILARIIKTNCLKTNCVQAESELREHHLAFERFVEDDDRGRHVCVCKCVGFQLKIRGRKIEFAHLNVIQSSDESIIREIMLRFFLHWSRWPRYWLPFHHQCALRLDPHIAQFTVWLKSIVINDKKNSGAYYHIVKFRGGRKNYGLVSV